MPDVDILKARINKANQREINKINRMGSTQKNFEKVYNEFRRALPSSLNYFSKDDLYWDIGDIKYWFYGASRFHITVHSLNKTWLIDSHCSCVDEPLEDIHLLEEAMLNFIGKTRADLNLEPPLIYKNIEEYEKKQKEDGKKFQEYMNRPFNGPSNFVVVPVLMFFIFIFCLIISALS